MTLQVARLGECLITFLAVKRLHPCMDSNVHLQAATPRKFLITFIAGIRFLDLSLVMSDIPQSKHV